MSINATELWYAEETNAYFRVDPAATREDGTELRALDGSTHTVTLAALESIAQERAEAALEQHFHQLETRSETLLAGLFPTEAETDAFDLAPLPEDRKSAVEAVERWLLDRGRTANVLEQLGDVLADLARGLWMIAEGSGTDSRLRGRALMSLAEQVREMAQEVAKPRLLGKLVQLPALVSNLETVLPNLAVERELQRQRKEYQDRVEAGTLGVAKLDMKALFGV